MIASIRYSNSMIEVPHKKNGHTPLKTLMEVCNTRDIGKLSNRRARDVLRKWFASISQSFFLVMTTMFIPSSWSAHGSNFVNLGNVHVTALSWSYQDKCSPVKVFIAAQLRFRKRVPQSVIVNVTNHDAWTLCDNLSIDEPYLCRAEISRWLLWPSYIVICCSIYKDVTHRQRSSSSAIDR